MFENAFNNIDKEMRNEQGLASELDYAETDLMDSVPEIPG